METPVQTWVGLGLALVAALGVNWGYTKEHDAAVALPPLSPRRPLASARILAGDQAWLVGFAAETGGWLVYLVALRLAPLALVQAVGAAGIAVLALASAGGHPLRLARHQRLAVLVALAGLALLAGSLVGSHPTSSTPAAAAATVWVAASIAGGVALSAVRSRIQRVAVLGLAAGLLMASGDISAKLVVAGGWWLLAIVPLVAGYALGSLVLQSAFQHGDALTAAGICTMTTNALPIAAGVVLFREDIPAGFKGALQVAAFAALVASATLLADLAGRGAARRP